jgi:hypothetical protein
MDLVSAAIASIVIYQVDPAPDEEPQEPEAAAAGIDRRMPGTKTRTQRNKEQRRRQVTDLGISEVQSLRKELCFVDRLQKIAA